MNPELLYFCETDRQKEIIEAVIECGTERGAARHLGCHHSVVQKTVKRVRLAAQKRNWSEENGLSELVDEYMTISKKSVLTDADGAVKLKWTQSVADKEKEIKLLQLITETLSEDIPREKPSRITRTENYEPNLLNCFILTDYHLGMLAWSEETNDDWDMKIAEDLLMKWLEYSISKSPNADTAVLAQLGDFLHWDGLDAVTPSSGHILDADTRFQLVVRVAIRCLRKVINRLLETHNHVHVIMAEGNHDLSGSVWLREWFNALYEDEPRITVELSPDPYYSFEWGDTSLFFHHGHKRKISDLDNVFAGKFRQTFGRTKYSYGHLGHLHHTSSKESPLMIVEQHRTLAAKDAYASRGGYISGRSAPVITYHKNYGEVGRLTITPEMVG